ncbi:MAG: hypothetical protein HFH35_08095 [Eubacterium sp.]|nr:hypothetical protein [Eubacterium sp.]
MGVIRKYTCKCGYEKDILAGGGLYGCNVNHIAKFFPEETKVFTKEREEGRVKQFIMENELSFCPNCKEIVAVPVFTYTRRDGSVCRFVGNCPDCGGEISQVDNEEQAACPKCGLRMTYLPVGNWD